MRTERIMWAVLAAGLLVGWATHAAHLQGRVDDGQDVLQEIYSNRDGVARSRHYKAEWIKSTLGMAVKHGGCLSDGERELWTFRFFNAPTVGGEVPYIDEFNKVVHAAAEHCNAGTPEETKEAKTFRLLGELTDALEVEK